MLKAIKKRASRLSFYYWRSIGDTGYHKLGYIHLRILSMALFSSLDTCA